MLLNSCFSMGIEQKYYVWLTYRASPYRTGFPQSKSVAQSLRKAVAWRGNQRRGRPYCRPPLESDKSARPRFFAATRRFLPGPRRVLAVCGGFLWYRGGYLRRRIRCRLERKKERNIYISRPSQLCVSISVCRQDLCLLADMCAFSSGRRCYRIYYFHLFY
jgi:hypothetical protein